MGRCAKLNHTISPSRTSRSSTSRIRASTLSYGGLAYILPSQRVPAQTLRYYLRVTLARRMGEVIKEKEIWVHSYRMPPDSNTSIKMEVGIEDCLHIEFEYNKAK